MSMPSPDACHLQAACGWLELGNHREADEELEKITPRLRRHPDVLEMRWRIYSQAGKWEACLDLADAWVKLSPRRASGHIYRSFALHKLKRTQEAFELLLPLVTRFPTKLTIPYSLACYAYQLGRLTEAERWLSHMHTIIDPNLKQLPAER